MAEDKPKDVATTSSTPQPPSKARPKDVRESLKKSQMGFPHVSDPQLVDKVFEYNYEELAAEPVVSSPHDFGELAADPSRTRARIRAAVSGRARRSGPEASVKSASPIEEPPSAAAPSAARAEKSAPSPAATIRRSEADASQATGSASQATGSASQATGPTGRASATVHSAESEEEHRFASSLALVLADKRSAHLEQLPHLKQRLESLRDEAQHRSLPGGRLLALTAEIAEVASAMRTAEDLLHDAETLRPSAPDEGFTQKKQFTATQRAKLAWLRARFASLAAEIEGRLERKS